MNEVEGYQYAFTARLRGPGRPPRQLFGRIVMLPEPYDYEEPESEYPPGQNPTRGVLLTMLATTLDEAHSARASATRASCSARSAASATAPR